MATNDYSPEVQAYLRDRVYTPASQYWGSDAGWQQANSMANQASLQGQKREDIEWANQQRMSDPNYWMKSLNANSGTSGGTLSNLANIEQSPSYQWRYNQGLEAVNRTAAARGMLGSGNRLAELTKYGQGMASQEYEAEFQRQLAQKKLENDAREQNMKMALSAMEMNKRYMAPGVHNVPGAIVTRWD